MYNIICYNSATMKAAPTGTLPGMVYTWYYLHSPVATRNTSLNCWGASVPEPLSLKLRCPKPSCIDFFFSTPSSTKQFWHPVRHFSLFYKAIGHSTNS